MTDERIKEIYETDCPLTEDELYLGWHFCDDFDGLPVSPTTSEWSMCNCFVLGRKFLYELRCKHAGLMVYAEPTRAESEAVF